MKAVILSILILSLAAGCSARRSEPVAGPFHDATPELKRGEIAFDAHCSHCHPGGEKGLAPAINNKPLPGFLIKFQVRHGVGAMPAFSEEEIGDEDLDAMVRYLKALRRN
ncbi:MAG TPA: cytochrome c [Thermoanaerobaculia bacterium]|nr:cytochrome c [Thermoanaerobaculia bacterium]